MTDRSQSHGADRLGFGCSGAWAMPWFPERRAEALIRAALDAGIRRFDTAPFYAEGEAERRLGAMLGSARDAVIVSTKTGTRINRRGAPVKDFSAAAIRADVEGSRRRLRRERIDIVYLHGPGPVEIAAARPVLDALVAEGAVAKWGVCAHEHGVDWAIDGGAAAVMAPFNLFERGAGEGFRRAAAAGLDTAAIAPIGQALFSRRFFQVRTPSDAWRILRALLRKRPELARARAAADAIEAAVEEGGISPVQAALAFTLAASGAEAAITTTTRPAHLQESLAASRLRLSPEAFARLDAIRP